MKTSHNHAQLDRTTTTDPVLVQIGARPMARYRRYTWLKVALLLTVGVAIYEIYDVWMTSQCSDEELQHSLQALCQLYKNEEVLGNLCPALCHTREISYINCLNYRHGKRIITASWRGDTVVLKSKLGYMHEFEDITYTLDNVTYTPEITEFNKMIIDSLAINFGTSIPERRDVLTRLWSMDFPTDEKFKIAAMRSLWSLIQQDEYLIFKYFDDNLYFPSVIGTCGHYYAVEYAPAGPVLGIRPLTYDDASPWRTRKELALKFLDMTKYLEGQLDGKFHLCDVKPENFGLNSDGQLKVIDVDMAFFSGRLFSQFELETCRQDGDCRVFDCSGRCDMERKICMKTRTNNNLQAICNKVYSHRLTTGYRGLLRNPPSLLEEDLETALSHCIDLNSSSKQWSEDLTERVYWRLVNLLKNPKLNIQISDYVGL